MVYPDSHTASFFNYPVFISVFMRSVFLCGAQSCAGAGGAGAGGAGAGGAGAGSAAVVSAVTRRTLCNLAVKQLMLPFDPFADLPYKGRRAKYPDHRAKGQNIYEKFCLICQIIVDGTDPAFHFRVIFRMLFIVGKMQHAPLQGVAFPADFENHWFRGLLDRFKTAGFKVWWA